MFSLLLLLALRAREVAYTPGVVHMVALRAPLFTVALRAPWLRGVEHRVALCAPLFTVVLRVPGASRLCMRSLFVLPYLRSRCALPGLHGVEHRVALRTPYYYTIFG
jgi:hypothetical protein